MAYPSLADPYLKTSRAKEHLEILKQEIRLFCESNPHRFVTEDDTEKQLHIVRAKLADTPDKIPLIAGDTLQNLRSALDHLVWSLAKLTLRYPKDTQFPILEAPNMNLFNRRTNGVPANAATMIESFQPYKRGNVHDHLLWKLNKLCNIDKHMRIPVHGVAGMVWWDNKAPFVTNGFDNNLEMRIPIAMKGKVGFNPRVTDYRVIFGDMYWGVEIDVTGIETIYEFVTNTVIPGFSRFF